MQHTILILCVLQLYIIVSNACKNCGSVEASPVCGTDGQTYRSHCDLERVACKEKRENHVDCTRKCPCDPPELAKMDNATVQALAQLRREIQAGNEDDNSNNVLGVFNREPVYLQNEACPAGEMAEMPRRLIDWFHVLKTNEREMKYIKEGIVKQPVLRQMKYLDAKLKAMYSKLACADNDDIVEKEVCLPSVKWMFHHLDSDNEGSLSAVELYEIEEISNEHCIKPFLKKCDRNKDGKVELAEFCKCLCLTPPCSGVLDDIPTVFINGKWKPFPGYFTPKCDEDGFFMPLQQNKRRREYWCVDRNGNEIEESRGTREPFCDINTRWQAKYKKIIPLDLHKENAPIQPKNNKL